MSVNMPTNPPLTLTDVEVARELRCGKTKARELIMAGEIPSVLIGDSLRLRRVRRSDLVAYLMRLHPAESDEGSAAA